MADEKEQDKEEKVGALEAVVEVALPTKDLSLAGIFEGLIFGVKDGSAVTVDSSSRAAPCLLTYSPGQTEEQRMFTALAELDFNGLDSYSTENNAFGFSPREAFLYLPKGMLSYNDRIEGVGIYKFSVTSILGMQLFMVNMHGLSADPAFTKLSTKIKAAICYLRVLLVAAGWSAQSHEVIMAAPINFSPGEWKAQIKKDKDLIVSCMDLVPVVPYNVELVFRKFTHHYLSSQSDVYERTYDQLHAAELVTEAAACIPNPYLYGRYFHWISLRVAYASLQYRSELGTGKISDALIKRAKSAPGGTAIVTSAAAVLLTMNSDGVLTGMKQFAGKQIATVMRMSATIKTSSALYHKYSFAYGARRLTAEEKVDLANGKAAAIALAPILQGYLSSLHVRSDLGKIKALKKHADNVPILQGNARSYFKALKKNDTLVMGDLFTTDVKRVIKIEP